MSVDLIYGNVTGLLRRVFIPASPDPAIGSGEVLVTISDAQYAAFRGLNDIQAYLNSITGRTPAGYRAAMVDQSGNVVSLHHADPGCDYPFGAHTIRWHDAAQVGWLFVNGQFIPLPGDSARRNYRPPRRLRRAAS